MKQRGNAYKLHKIIDNVSCDYIISDRYRFQSENKKMLAQHILEEVEPDFINSITYGDFLIAGYNFGCGSTREQAPQALQAAGIKAIIAKSYAWTFYRNAFNNGLLLVECNTDHIEDKDELEIDLDNTYIRNLTRQVGIKIHPIEPAVIRLYTEGGLIEHLKKNNNKYNRVSQRDVPFESTGIYY
jgi:3-isopropylmalate/(R)-2-methylmalate dehydratase small subunit